MLFLIIQVERKYSFVGMYFGACHKYGLEESFNRSYMKTLNDIVSATESM
jgi:hypothetical protein